MPDRDIVHPQWISVEDALPGLNEKVVVLIRGGGFDLQLRTFFAYLETCEDNHFSWRVETWGGSVRDVLGWCPLPRDECKTDG